DQTIYPLEQMPLAIHRQTILLGDRRSNPLMAMLVDDYLLSPRPLDERYPGPGRALAWWSSGLFGLEHDIVALYACDEPGLVAGAMALPGVLAPSAPAVSSQ